MTNKTDKNKLIWTISFLVIPAIILARLAEIYTDNSLNRILIAGLLGGLGAILGAVFLHFANSKSTIFKTALILLLFGLCLSILFIETERNKSILKTCEICGYKAIHGANNRCEYCGSLTWEKQKMIKGYDDKTKWLKEEQLNWFAFDLDSFTNKSDFYNPPIDEGFLKDMNWRPLVTEQEIKDELNLDK